MTRLTGRTMCPSSRDPEAIESYWQEVEDRIEAAEFAPIARADEERCEREINEELRRERPGIYDLEGRV